MRALLALLTAAFVATAFAPAAEASHVLRLPSPTGADGRLITDPLVSMVQWPGGCFPWCLNLTTVPSTVEGPAGTTNLVSRMATPEICNPALIGSQAHCYHVHAGCYELGRGYWACWHGLIWCDTFVNGPLPGDDHLADACTHA